VNERLLALERAVEAVLTSGLALATALLLYGLARTYEPALRAGIVILMFTPVARVLLVTLGLFKARDLLFGSISAFVLAVLASSVWVAFHP
jgi:hypothetical protein